MTLGDVAHLAAIATALVTGGAAVYYFWLRRSRCKRLVSYLRKAKAEARDDKKGQKSITHLMAECGMSEADILDAAFRSKLIELRVTVDKATGRAEDILLEYDPASNSN